MIAQTWKDLWYVAWAPLLEGNLYRHKLFNGHKKQGLKLNIGCGSSRFSGWLNIDGNFRHHPDMWLDVTRGLPFKPGSVEVIYASHFFEHLYLAKLKRLLVECRRVLSETGVLRVAVPNLEAAIIAYQRDDPIWFSRFPAEFRSVGGRFFNEMLCDDQHRLMFDFTFIDELLVDAGFSEITRASRGKSRFLAADDGPLAHEKAADSGKLPDPWLLVKAIP